jgi:hypothetical protein
MENHKRDAALTGEPAEKIIELWIQFREASGFTREAALAELQIAASVIAQTSKD